MSSSLSSAKLRSLAFALLARREYSAADLKSKLLEAGADGTELEVLMTELSHSHYQSDERMAGMLVRQNIRKGRGMARIQQDLKKHHLDPALAQEELREVNWLQQAIELRVKKFGQQLPADQKEKNRQVRFLQYRGFDLDVCFKAISTHAEDDL